MDPFEVARQSVDPFAAAKGAVGSSPPPSGGRGRFGAAALARPGVDSQRFLSLPEPTPQRSWNMLLQNMFAHCQASGELGLWYYYDLLCIWLALLTAAS